MISRLIAALSVAGGLLSIVLLDPGQFVYPYMGLIAGIVAFFKLIGADSPAFMIIFPLLFIVVMIAFFSFTAFTMIMLSLRVFISSPTLSLRKIVHSSTALLSITLFVGLALLRAFPGEQEKPLTISGAYFIYPLLLAGAALSLFWIDNKSEKQDAAMNVANATAQS